MALTTSETAHAKPPRDGLRGVGFVAVVVALGANLQISFELRTVKNSITAGAFAPQSFGHGSLVAIRLDS